MALLRYAFVVLAFVFLFHESGARIFSRKRQDQFTIVELKKGLNSIEDVLNLREDISSHRKRRAPDTSSPIVSSTTLRDKNHNQAIVHWSGENSNAIFVLTREIRRNGSVTDSTLYRSVDYGSSFQKQPFQETKPLIDMFYVTAKDKTKLLLTDTVHGNIYYTTNEGQSFEKVTVLFQPDRVLPHPSLSDYLLAYSYKTAELFVSTDFAKSWKKMHRFVNPSFYWETTAVGRDSRSVHMEVQDPATGESYYKVCPYPYTDCQQRAHHAIGKVDTNSLLVQDEYIFLEKTSDSASKLYVSHHGGSFREAYFPLTLFSQDFQIIDTSEHQVFVAVNHNNTAINVYLSDQTGQYFVLSLENVVPIPATKGQFDVELHEIKSMPGTYVANIMVSAGYQVPFHKTKISFDKGGDWRSIRAPSVDHEGKPISCDIAVGCSLNLHMQFSQGFNYVPMLVSNEKAPGIILAHGTPGKAFSPIILRPPPNMYMSTDGGVTWKQVFAGTYEFNILDQGGAIVAATSSSYNITNKIWYSCTEGQSWHSYNFSSALMHVDGMLNEPGISTLVSSIYGHTQGQQSGWIITKLNFSSILTRKCGVTDYTTWIPTVEGKQCILGQKLTYQRRKPTAVCSNGVDYSRPNMSESCVCTQEDFECDFGYEEKSIGHCVQAAWFTDPQKPFGDCPEGSTYNISKGYRKVASDKCVGGDLVNRYRATVRTCPIQPPGGLEITTDKHKLIAPSNKEVTFVLSQSTGSRLTTTYTWKFSEKDSYKKTGFKAANTSTHTFLKAGTYTVSVTASNSAGRSQHSVTIKIEDEITGLVLEEPYGAQVNKTTNFIGAVSSGQSKQSEGFAHYVWTFGDNPKERPLLTWNNSVNHMYTSVGYYTVTVEAINAVSSMYRMFKVRVYKRVITVELSFLAFFDKLYQDSIAWRARFGDAIRTQVAQSLSVSKDYLEVAVLPQKPIKVHVCFVPPKSENASNSAIDKLSQYFLDNVKAAKDDGFQIYFQGTAFSVASAKLVVDTNTPSVKTTAHLVAVYIAVPVLFVAVVIIALVILYYKRKFTNLRHYAMLRQRPHAESLLDQDDEDEDDAPLDLNPSRDIMPEEPMYGEAGQPTLVMMTGTNGGRSNNSADC